MEAENSITLTT